MGLRMITTLMFLMSFLVSEAHEQVLFMNPDSALVLELTTDVQALIQDKSEDPEYTDAQLTYFSPENEVIEFAIKVKPRGGTRRFSGWCDLPRRTIPGVARRRAPSGRIG